MQLNRVMQSLRHSAASLRSSRDGNFATLTALTAPVALIIASFAIDEGTLYMEKRDLQSITDLAAIAAAANIAEAENTARLVLRDNGHAVETGSEIIDTDAADGSDCTLAVARGVYTPDPSVAAADRFVVSDIAPNAVRVTYCERGTRYFSAGFFGAPRVAVSAVAATRDEAAFSVGSRLARLEGGVANAILGSMTSSSISLTAMDYEALLSTDIRLLSFLSALDSNLALDAASYNDLLLTEVSAGNIAGALAHTEGVSADAMIAAGKLATALSGGNSRITLSRLLDLGVAGLFAGRRRAQWRARSLSRRDGPDFGRGSAGGG